MTAKVCRCRDGFVLTYVLPDGTPIESGRCLKCMERASAAWSRAMHRIFTDAEAHRRAVAEGPIRTDSESDRRE